MWDLDFLSDHVVCAPSEPRFWWLGSQVSPFRTYQEDSLGGRGYDSGTSERRGAGMGA